jgi:thiol-disulfide isomerase/thioredoxin
VLRRGSRASELVALASLALGFLAAYWLLRPGPSTLANAAAVTNRIGAGQPVLLEFQSPYCLGCMAARPVVDSIEREHLGQLGVIRLNIQEPAGTELASQYRAQYTPTFIMLDGTGQELWRTIGAVDPLDVRRSLSTP